MNRIFAASTQALSALKQLSRHWISFFATVALLTGGFYFRRLPASLVVTAYGTPLAALGITLVCLFVVYAATTCWLLVAPSTSSQKAVERTCLSLMLASMFSLWACIGPIGGTFYAHGRFVRMALWFASFAALQWAWMREWGRKLLARVPQVWRERDLITWPDAILVATVAVFASEMATYFDRPYIQVTPFALLMNIALLAAAIVLAWAVFGRGLFAAALTVCGYFVLSFLNVMKIKYLHSGLQPGDQVYLSELLYYKDFFSPRLLGGVAIVTALAVGILIYAWRKSARRYSLAPRGRLFAGALLAFVSLAIIPWLPGSGKVLLHLGIVEEQWDSYVSVKRNGLLCELALQFPESYVPCPANYSREAIKQIVSEQRAAEASSETTTPTSATGEDQPAVNIVVFLFESLIEPHDLNRPLQREVIPNIRQMQAEGLHGFAISPRLLGGSAESEFEVITGMSTGFLPPNSCAYKHYMKRPMPSLASLLKAEGYYTTALQVVPSGFYNYREVYQHFGFDRFRSEDNLVNPKRAEGTINISDETFVDEMIAALKHKKPAFVTGFNQASHAPYPAHMLQDQPRFLVEPSNPASDQIEVYLQKINHTDEQIGRLIQELSVYPEPVVLLLVGDHHPPFAADSHAYEIPAYQASGPAGELFRRRVPFVVWKNFEQDETDTTSLLPTPSADGETYISMNFLSLLLLQAADIEPQGLFALDQKLIAECPVVSRDLFYSQGQAKVWNDLPSSIQKSIEEYQLLQYDVLIGEDFALKLWKPSKRIARRRPIRFRTS